MDSHIGFRQSTRVAIRNSLKESQPVSEKPKAKVEKRGRKKKAVGEPIKVVVTVKKSRKRKHTAVKRAGKKQTLKKVETSTMMASGTEKEVRPVNEDNPMEVSLSSEEISIEDCTMSGACEPEIGEAFKSTAEHLQGKPSEEVKVAAKKDSRKRKQKAPKRIYTEAGALDAKPASIQHMDMNANVVTVPEKEASTEDVLMEDCATTSGIEKRPENAQKAIVQPAKVIIKTILDKLMETFSEDLAQLNEEGLEDKSDSIKAQLASLLKPLPQKLSPLAREQEGSLSPINNEKQFKICSWCIDGQLTEVVVDYFKNSDWDIFCFQGLGWSNMNAVPSAVKEMVEPYYSYWHFEKMGFCLLVVSRIQPKHELLNGNFQKHSPLTLAFEDFTLVSAVAPPACFGLAKLGEKLKWFEDFILHLKIVEEEAPVIVAGSLGVAAQDIGKFSWSKDSWHFSDVFFSDVDAPQVVEGLTKEERSMMCELQAKGFTDTFREMNPGKKAFTTFTTHPMIGRLEGTGMRSDYFIVSKRFKQCVESSIIRSDIAELSHSPIELEVNLE